MNKEKDFFNYFSDFNLVSLYNNIGVTENIFLYAFSYFNFILKELEYECFQSFFERDCHSFEPYKRNCIPLSINNNKEAFETFKICLAYMSKSKHFTEKERLKNIYSFFEKINIKIIKKEQTMLCECISSKHKSYHELYLSKIKCDKCNHTGIIKYEHHLLDTNSYDFFNKITIDFYKYKNTFMKNLIFFAYSNKSLLNVFEDFDNIVKEINLITKVKNF